MDPNSEEALGGNRASKWRDGEPVFLFLSPTQLVYSEAHFIRRVMILPELLAPLQDDSHSRTCLQFCVQQLGACPSIDPLGIFGVSKHFHLPGASKRAGAYLFPLPTYTGPLLKADWCNDERGSRNKYLGSIRVFHIVAFAGAKRRHVLFLLCRFCRSARSPDRFAITLGMAGFPQSRRLKNIVTTSSSNPVAVAAIPDPYPSDGPGLNYIVTRDLVADVAAYELGFIDYATLLARREIKLGECKDFGQRLCGYRACQQMYRHEWKAYYTTPERKLTEHLEQDETRSSCRPRTVCSCQKRHMEWVDYMAVGGEMGLEAQFYRWVALRGHTSIATYIV
ncbi:hypothetical protein DFH08DRAFT_827953 [Mycena albidolilacea]|uniref:Uncharacterized protein n=1 Tax=Mycena albidolilacea TaxID=1033008 RepID=A0AAD6YY04_9AGAR|nr:hypothetical protein DFH08DRAFT_827953 [Mycena albidolilacea]